MQEAIKEKDRELAALKAEVSTMKTKQTEQEAKIDKAAQKEEVTQLKTDVVEVKTTAKSYAAVASKTVDAVGKVVGQQRKLNARIEKIPADVQGKPEEVAKQVFGADGLGLTEDKAVKIVDAFFLPVKPAKNEGQDRREGQRGKILIVKLGSESDKRAVFASRRNLKDKKFSCVTIDDDLSHEAVLCRSLPLKKRKEIIEKGTVQKKDARVTNLDMWPVLVSRKGDGQWVEHVPVKKGGVAEWNADRMAEDYDWKERGMYVSVFVFATGLYVCMCGWVIVVVGVSELDVLFLVNLDQ